MPTTGATVSIGAEIERANEVFMDTFRRGDGPGMGALYTQDCVLLAPGSRPVTGQHATGEFWQGAMNLGVRTVRLTTLEVEQHGDGAWEMGAATLHADDDVVVDEVKYVVVWKREHGTWRLHRDIWNSNRMPQ